jgi:hypothetical protein
MARQLKAFAGAGFFGLIALGFQISGYTNLPFAYFFWGLAGFWGIVAVFRNKKLIRRFPGIVDWFPFLEDDPAAIPKELTGTYLRGHTLRLLDVAFNGQIEGRTIEDCTIIGPAMIALMGTSVVQSCVFSVDNLENLVVELPLRPRRIFGAIAVKDTVFRRCRFIDIGFIGEEGILEKFKAGFTAGP